MDSIPPRLIDITTFMIHISKGKMAVSILSRLVVAATSYYIWLERNGRLFKKKTSSPDQIVEVIIYGAVKVGHFQVQEDVYQARLLLDQLKIPSCCIVHNRSFADVPEIYMQQLWFTISKINDSSLYQFKLDKKKCRIDMEVFQDILQICPRLPNQKFDEPPSDEEIVSFIKELSDKGSVNQTSPKLAISRVEKGETSKQKVISKENVKSVENGSSKPHADSTKVTTTNSFSALVVDESKTWDED
nr:RNA-directed DNA polymerase, eukaryota, reverse transcriptase zinc-binding domain protein [Tanacetum cinerariifolium]